MRVEMLSEAIEAVKERLRRKFCRHERPRYDEIRTEDDNGRVYWSSVFECAECGEILTVFNSYSGDPNAIAVALRENEGTV